MHLAFKYSLQILIATFALLILGCGPEQKKDSKTKEEQKILEEEKQKIEQNVKEVKKVFYSLPSPLETAILFKRAGASFNKDILNSFENVSKYTSSRQKAFNLGVYIADLSYASLFEQNQLSLEYMAAAKKMGEGLGITNEIDKEMISRLENNVNNKAVVMDIISKAFVNSDFSLKENDRAGTACVMLIGGWIEGLHIGTQLAQTTKNNKQLIERIVDQRLPLQSIMGLMKLHKDNEDVKVLAADIDELNNLFNKIKIKSSLVKPVVDSKSNVTTLKSSKETVLGQDVFNQVCKKIEQIRNKYIN